MAGLTHNCAGMPRRDFLQLGIGGVLGIGFADLLRLRANAVSSSPPPSKATGKQINCIMIWLDGGPSHYETFDPKPDAPSEIRGEFKAISTSVPGVQFSEAVPNLAKAADKLTIVRSICHKDPNHGGGNHYMMTGAPTPVPVACGAFVTFHPSFGSVVSHHRGVHDGMPAYMSIPSVTRSGGPNFLGGKHAPFVINGNPNDKSFTVRDVVLPSEISESRARSRRELRASLDRMKRYADKLAEDPAVTFDQYYQQGVDLVLSPQAQAAFDIHREDEKVREAYGRNDFGQRLLLARRLVEVGVSWVTVYNGGWDHHTKIFDGFKGDHGKKMDIGVAALINDLDQRGLLDNTMVIMLGEFGRTPKVNKDAGRDHWPHAMSVLMAGAGIPRGAVVGATDAKGYHAAENVYRPEDFAASLYTKMGIDPAQVLHTNTGRPVQLVSNGRLIKELFV
ncbi:MAG TPA: DUF1501 domain-containing protein [Candidatus Eisenbacteria bacterium]|nr:DUF1501 domain-containing protein [Candidatus Eisenbacteria bacterium]